jgi:hypothetical protein
MTALPRLCYVLLVTLFMALLCLAAGVDEAHASETPPWRENLRCDPSQQRFQGLEYCVPNDGLAYHVMVLDLYESGVGLEIVMPVGLDKDNRSGECRDVNRSTKYLGGPGCDDPGNRQFYPVMSLETASNLAQARFPGTAVVINGDYGAKEPSDNPTRWRDHGPEGFTVVRGQRLDGVGLGDGDNNAEQRPWLAVGQGAPLVADLSQFPRGTDDGSKPGWVYSAAGGAPWMIRDGVVQSADIRPETCTGAPGSCYDGAAQTAVGLSADGRWLFLVVDKRGGGATLQEMAEFMQGQLGANDAIKFDGGGSTQLWYEGAFITRGDGRWLSQYLAVTALPGHGIDDVERPVLYASPVSALVYDVAMPAETAKLVFEVRNEGRDAWSGSEFEFVALSGNLPGAPASLLLTGDVLPGHSVTWIVQTSVPSIPGVRSIRYQMQHGGEPFGDAITGYVFVLPEGLQNLEQQIKDQIEQWQQQGQQTVEELLQQLGDMIAQAAAQQAQNWIDRLIEGCSGSLTLLGGVIAGVVFHLRNRRS